MSLKIEIELMTNGSPLNQQMEAIHSYIDKFKTIEQSEPRLGWSYNIYIIKETGKHEGFEIGEKIYLEHNNYHVSCKKTKGGLYKFKVWGAN